MELSVIIVTYNSENYILNCLSSLERAVRNIQHEIFIIDNNSTDQTKSRIRDFTGAYTLIENRQNYGFARAVNIGLERGSGGCFLIINPDIVITSDSLRPMIDFMKNNPKAGMCGCKLLNDDGSLQYSMGSFPTLLSILCRIVLPRRMRKYRLRGYEKVTECDWVTGAFTLVRNNVVRQVGYLDENYFLHYEDVDYCLQAKKKGWRTYYHPAVSAYHFRPHAMVCRNPLVEKEIRKSRLYFFGKNISRFSCAVLSMLTKLVEERIYKEGIVENPNLKIKAARKRRRFFRWSWG